MNNLQYIIRNNTRAAMHMAVELCEQGDFDYVLDAVKWLMQERNDATHGGGKVTAEQVRKAIEKRFDIDLWVPKERWQAIADELNSCEIGKKENDG